MMLDEDDLIKIQNREFLLRKVEIIRGVKQLFSEAKNRLDSVLEMAAKTSGLDLSSSRAKISQGENYRGLPYVVLDHPGIFEKDNVVALRTMFWWGHEFSNTIHLQGRSLEKIRPCLVNHFSEKGGQEVYVCVNDSPWEYDFEIGNYQKFDPNHLTLLKEKPFIKLSRKYELQHWASIPQKTLEFFTWFFLETPLSNSV